MEEQIDLVGKAFVDHYYHLFENDRPALSSLYQPSSMLTFEGQKVQGVEDITAKLNQLPFDQCRHVISTIDSQPSSFSGAIVVFVSGSIQLPGEEHQLQFSQKWVYERVEFDPLELHGPSRMENFLGWVISKKPISGPK